MCREYRLHNQISTSMNSVESVESQRTHHVQKIYEQQRTITDLQSELRLAQRRLNSFEEANKEAQESAVASESNSQRANDRVKTLEKEVLLLKQEVAAVKSERRVLEEDGIVLKSRLDEAQRNLSHVKDDLRESLRERDSLQKQIDELKIVLSTMSGNEKVCFVLLKYIFLLPSTLTRSVDRTRQLGLSAAREKFS